MSRRNAEERLRDIIECAEKIMQYVEDCNYEQFSQNSMMQDAVIRNLEIIGEAAKHLPSEIIDAISGVEWKQIIRMRDLLAHAYHKILIYTIWDVAVNKVPSLRQAVKKFLR